MKIFAILLTVGESENVQEVKATDETRWCLLLTDPSTGEERKVWVEPDEEHETESGRSSSNFVMKWKDSHRECTVDIREVGQGWSLEEEDGPLVTFECKNAEIKACYLTDKTTFDIVFESGGSVEGEEFSDGDWCGFDEDADGQASLLGLATKAVEVKIKGGKARRRKKK